MQKKRHDTDFEAWVEGQITALRVGRFYDLDPVRLAVALDEFLAGRKGVVETQVVTVLESLLKLEHSPAEEPRKHWIETATAMRKALENAFSRSGTLWAHAEQTLPESYRRARDNAAALLAHDGVRAEQLPSSCPYTLSAVLDPDWFPGNRHGHG